MGPPGAGKGTQGALLAEARAYPKFATGDLLRDAVARGTPLGLRAKQVMESGNLVSDDIILGIVRDELGKPGAAQGVIFDGVVRTIPQAEGVGRLLAEKGRQMDAVLFFDVRTTKSSPASPSGVRSKSAPTTTPKPWPPGCGPTGNRPPPCSTGTNGETWFIASPRQAPWKRSRSGSGGPLASNMITLKSPREVEIMGRAGRIVAGTLARMGEILRPGMSTEDLDADAERFIRSHAGAIPSFKGLYGFPKTLCISIDEEIVHGIPSSRRILEEGSIVSVDVGVQLEGLHADRLPRCRWGRSTRWPSGCCG